MFFSFGSESQSNTIIILNPGDPDAGKGCGTVVLVGLFLVSICMCCGWLVGPPHEGEIKYERAALYAIQDAVRAEVGAERVDSFESAMFVSSSQIKQIGPTELLIRTSAKIDGRHRNIAAVVDRSDSGWQVVELNTDAP